MMFSVAFIALVSCVYKWPNYTTPKIQVTSVDFPFNSERTTDCTVDDNKEFPKAILHAC